MKRALVLVALGGLVGLTWSVSRALGGAAGGEPAVCRDMTAGRMLENPAIAEEWAAALRSARPAEIARVRAMLADIRAAHGCDADLSLPAPPEQAAPDEEDANELPPGHPPVGEALPPGHPPVGDRGLPTGHPPVPPSARTPIFEPPTVVEI